MTRNKDAPTGFIITLWLIIVFLSADGKADDEDDEPISNIKELRKYLMDKYDKYSRPVKNASTSVSVSIQIAYLSVRLHEINELEEIMELGVVMLVYWKDEHLQWDPINYKGINHMHFDKNDIWHPDFIIWNSAPVTNNIPWNKTEVMVNNDGDAIWYPPASIVVRCPMLLLKPMEERLCNISVGSYSHYLHELDLKLAKSTIGVEDMRHNNNPIWEITNITDTLETLEYDAIHYSIATFTIHVKRRHDFVSEVLHGPRTAVILLTLVMFLLPPTSDKKLNLGCLTLFVLVGITLYFSSTVESSSLLSATVASLQTILFTITSALLIEVFIINLSRLSNIVRPSPVLIHILSRMVGRVFGICSPLEYKQGNGVVRSPETEEEEISQPTITIEEEWGLVAMALDRIFFIIYAAIFVIISL